MSANIEIWKIFEDKNLVTYAFGDMGLFSSKSKGKVVILKKTGKIYLVESADKTLSQKRFEDVFAPRIRQALADFREHGVYPDQKNLPGSGPPTTAAAGIADVKDAPLWRHATSTAAIKDKLDKILICFLASGPDGFVKLTGSGFIVVAAGRKAMVMTACHQFYLYGAVPHPKPTYPSTKIHEFNVHTGELFDVDNEKIKAVYQSDNFATPCIIQGVSMVPELNIALCAIELPNDYTGPGFSFQLGLDSKIPKIGDEVAAIGFSGMAGNSLKLEMRIGSVTGVFSNGSSRAAWPCFETTIPVQDGMQGGPVLPFTLSSMSMNVCAVISSDMSSQQAFKEFSVPGRSIMAMIWPSLALPFSTVLKPTSSPAENNLLGLIKKGKVKDAGEADKKITIVQKNPHILALSRRG